MEAYHEGRLAYIQGWSLDDNPYDESSPDWDEWDSGFLDVAESPEWREWEE